MFAERSFLSCLYNTLIFMHLLNVACSFGVIYDEYVVDQGKNLTLQCKSPYSVMWVHEGRRDDFQQFQSDGSLHLSNLNAKDAGLYTCSELVATITTVHLAASETLDSSTNNTTTSEESLLAYNSRNETHNSTISEEDEQPQLRGTSPESGSVPDRYEEIRRVRVKVRTPPLAVSSFYVRASTIIAVLVWEVMPNRTGGYVIRDFTAEMRRLRTSEEEPEERWEVIDPRHITPNARQLEIYHLIPNTTYEFRIWANNALGAGEIVTTTATTSPDMEEKDLIRRIMIDAQNFDTRVWIAAVGVVMGTLVILSLGTCIVLYKECREPIAKDEELDSLELVPNIILNPGFCDSDDQGQNPLSPPMPRAFPLLPLNSNGQPQIPTFPRPSYYNHSSASYGSRYHYDNDDNDDYEEEPMTFSRRMSIFFTGNTIKRI
ncbi:uncharacterized protein LOC129772199 [Toxorhynchites rutilus septentrionalis]|uniref:uncharacterized protein LOC129772199 n=1 Tax=Toxorhynchites rutilus septentrionalis TaxID=329112 RepID=UPI002478A434|nr:uncharacterized protein LOC129772199 [Toxorhynchites rutilus septentrionalis]